VRFFQTINVILCVCGVVLECSTSAASPAPLPDRTDLTGPIATYESAPPTNGIEVLRKSAKDGDANAEFQLGVLYNEGKVVPQDIEEAVRLFRSAADKGLVEAQYHLGLMYTDGLGVPSDAEESAKWFRKSADQGFAQGQTNLGTMYVTGTGVPQDYQEAVRLFRSAAEQGLASAQSNLGLMYADGTGVSQDIVLADVWFNVAAIQGNAEAAALKDQVEKNMTSSQRERARDLARVCRAAKYKNCDEQSPSHSRAAEK
jgi:TPR repeat protein